MRGQIDEQGDLFHVFNVETRIRKDHPLRDVKRRVDRILASLGPSFQAAYSRTGRPSVPPERLLKALLLMSLYSVRSERQLCDRLATDLLFRWFLDLAPSDEAFDPTTFSHNRARLDQHNLTKEFFAAVVRESFTAGLCSEHFSVDGTLIESFASLKSFQPKDEKDEKDEKASEQKPPDDASPDDASPDGPPSDGEAVSTSSSTPNRPRGRQSNGFKPRNAAVDFRGQKRTNQTHVSRTDPEAKLYRKGRGQESKLAHLGHALSENRHGLLIAVTTTEACGTAERDAALLMLDEVQATHRRRPKSLGADKGYDAGEFFRSLESRGIEPHASLTRSPRDPATASAQDRPNVEARVRMQERQSSEAYRLSQKRRKTIEEGFGWLKMIAGFYRSRVAKRWKLQQLWEIGAAAYNLLRLRKLAPVA